MRFLCKGLVIDYVPENPLKGESVVINDEGDLLYYSQSDENFSICKGYAYYIKSIKMWLNNREIKIIAHPLTSKKEYYNLLNMLNSGDKDSIDLAIGIIENYKEK